MPEDRLARARRSLPAGYRFGDAASLKQSYRRLVEAVEGARCEIGDTIVVKIPKQWRRPSENAAEQLARDAHWNVIEGEHHE